MKQSLRIKIYKMFTDILYKRDFSALKEYSKETKTYIPEDETKLEIVVLRSIYDGISIFNDDERKLAEAKLFEMNSKPLYLFKENNEQTIDWSK